jgi:outer membrane protein assembly factor BamB
MRVNGTDAVTVQAGVAYAASDGRVVWKNPQLENGKGGGWGAPLFLDNKLYLNFLGVSSFTEADFTGVAAEPWKAKMRYFEIEVNHHRPNGEWLDRSSPASPLVLNGVNYAIDDYGVLYALDLTTGKTLYQQESGFDELHSYVHIGVAASPTLIGKNIVVMDNQGSALVFQPGQTFKKVAMNRIETMPPRDWPMPPQEITANSPPVPDGERIYIRGEQYMYCIGRK